MPTASFLAVRLSGYGNLGAYITGVAPGPLSLNTGKNLASVYRTPLLGVDIKTVVTNTTLMGAYRGAGRPEANYYMERLIDTAADEMGINRFTLRKRNFIKPSQLPFPAASGVTYDSGDFAGVFQKALEISDYDNFTKRKKESKKSGKLRGIAVGSYLEVTAPPIRRTRQDHLRARWFGEAHHRHARLRPGPRHAVRAGPVRPARRAVREDHARTGRQRPGAVRQRHRRLALDHGDRPGDRRGLGAGGREGQEGRRAYAGGVRGRHRVRPGPLHHRRHRPLDRHHGARRADARGQDCRRARPRRSTSTTPPRRRASTFPNGCHVAEVEIDPDTGVTRIVRYSAVNDFGTVVNPMIVAGQLHGGVAQGIGQALMEEVSYDASGQPITGSFMDYALPRAGDVPSMQVGDHPSPAKSNPLGTKGCGEGRLRRQPRLRRQRGGRRAVGIRHQAHQHAADAGARLARDPGRQGERGVSGRPLSHLPLSSPAKAGDPVFQRQRRVEPRGRGVLDTPHARGMTPVGAGAVLPLPMPSPARVRSSQCLQCALQKLQPVLSPEKSRRMAARSLARRRRRLSAHPACSARRAGQARHLTERPARRAAASRPARCAAADMTSASESASSRSQMARPNSSDRRWASHSARNFTPRPPHAGAGNRPASRCSPLRPDASGMGRPTKPAKGELPQHAAVDLRLLST